MRAARIFGAATATWAMGLVALLASCSQLIGIHDDLTVSDASAGADGSTGGDGAGGDDALSDGGPGDDGSSSDSGFDLDASLPPCTANFSGVCDVKDLNAIPTALAAAGGSVYYSTGTGIVRLDGEGGPLPYASGNGAAIGALAASGNTVSFVSTADKIVHVSDLAGNGAGTTSAQSSAPGGVALTATDVGWFQGTSALSAPIANLAAAPNSLPLPGATAIAGASDVFALLSVGPTYAVRTCRSDGNDAGTYQLAFGTAAFVSVDPNGAPFAAEVSSSSTTIYALTSGVSSSEAIVSNVARAFLVGNTDFFLVVDPSTGSKRLVLRIPRATPSNVFTLSERPLLTGLLAHDPSLARTYWVDQTGTATARIVRFSP